MLSAALSAASIKSSTDHLRPLPPLVLLTIMMVAAARPKSAAAPKSPHGDRLWSSLSVPKFSSHIILSPNFETLIKFSGFQPES